MKLSLSFCFTILIALSVSAGGAILHVPLQYGSIGSAVAASSSKDTILVEPGTYVENIRVVGRPVVIASRNMFDSDFATVRATIIDGSNPADPDKGSVVTFSGKECSGSGLIGFTIKAGIGSFLGNRYAGGGVLVEGGASVTITGNLIIANSAQYGGGISVSGSSAVLARNVVAGNYSTYGGGLDFQNSTVTVSHCIVRSNDASGKGGAMHCVSCPKITLSDNIFSLNTSLAVGGIFSDQSTLQIRFNDFWKNKLANLSPAISGFGDTTRNHNFNYVPSDSFMNIFRDPAFTDPGALDFRLACRSSLVDAGSELSTNCLHRGSRTDIGPFELSFLAGDATGDGFIDLEDAIAQIKYIFLSGPPSCPAPAGDWNCDRRVNILDVVLVINYIFGGGPGPCLCGSSFDAASE